MKTLTQTKPLRLKPLLWAVIVSAAFLIGSTPVAFAEFVVSYGHIGTMATFKGQIRDGLDAPVPDAHLQIRNLSTKESYSIKADEKGVFSKDDLPSGKYAITIMASGFNLAKYSVRINRNSKRASRKYTVVRLSPGCATGNSGLALLTELNQPSFHN